MKQDQIILYLLFTLVLFLFTYSFMNYVCIPVVVKSYVTKQCLEVDSNDGYSCNNLPYRYEIIWRE